MANCAACGGGLLGEDHEPWCMQTSESGYEARELVSLDSLSPGRVFHYQTTSGKRTRVVIRYMEIGPRGCPNYVHINENECYDRKFSVWVE